PHTPPTAALFPYTTLFRSRTRQPQRIQTSTFLAIRDSKLLVTGEQLQSAIFIGAGSNTGTGSVDSSHDGLQITALGQLDFSAIQDRKSTRLNSSHVKISYA